MLAVPAGHPLDPSQSGDGPNRYNETMLVRNLHLRVAIGVLMVLAVGPRAGLPMVMAGDGVTYVEVCTREGLKRVPVDGPAQGEHEAGSACHLIACTALAHGAGVRAGSALPALVPLLGLAVVQVADRRGSRVLPVVLRARGPPLVLASLKGAPLPDGA